MKVTEIFIMLVRDTEVKYFKMKLDIYVFMCFLLLFSGCLSSEIIPDDQYYTSMDNIITMIRQMKSSLHKQHRRLVARMIKLDNKFEEIQTLISSVSSDVEDKSRKIIQLHNKLDTIQDKLDILINNARTSRCQDDDLTNIQHGYGKNESDALEGELQKSKAKYTSCNSHMGKEYVIMFPRGYGKPKLPQLLISSVEDASVTFESLHPGINRTVNVTADSGAVVNFPKSIFQKGSSIENKGILLRSTSDIFVTGFPITESDKGDIYNAIPVKNLGKSYLYIGYDHSVMSIVALQDNTHVNITVTGWNSPKPLSGIRVKNERYNRGDVIRVTLKRLSTFQLFGDSTLLNIRVDSDKTVGVLSGTYVDGFDGKYNSLLSYIPPLSSFGTKFIVPPIPFSNHSTLFIFSRNDQSNRYVFFGRTYFYSGSFPGYRRQQRMKARIPYLVTTSVPSIVAQMPFIWTSWVFPSQTLIPSITHFSNYYKFMTPPTTAFRQYASIIIPKNYMDGLRFDGVAIRNFTPDVHVLPVDEVDYNVIVLQIDAGQHEVFHINDNVTFGVIIQGTSSTQTYGFPAGLRLSDNCP